MKNLIEILGGAQRLLGFNFDPDSLFEERLTAEHRGFLALLCVIEEHLPDLGTIYSRIGRPRFDDLPFIRAYLAKHCYQIDKNNLLRERLLSDSSLRQICGFKKVPSEATFSRRLEQFAKKNLPISTLSKLVQDYHDGQLVRVVARDSTTIKGREKAKNKKTEVKVKKQRRGRPRKGEIRAPKEPKRVERQLRQSAGKSLSELDTACSWTCKQNSQGKPQYTKGYKIHWDVTDRGIPISAFVTGANVHDSQVAIPLEKMTERRITHLYTMADSAYDFPEHRCYILAKGRIPIIDPNNRRSQQTRALGKLEQAQYKARTVVERANSHLKDHLLPAALYVKGHCKVSFVLLMGVLCLAAIKIIQLDWSPPIITA